MGRQKNMPQMKEQEKSPERELHEMDGGKRFIRERVIRVLQELSENCTGMKKDTETVRKNQSEDESTIPEEKNALEGINSRVVRLKERWGRSPCPRFCLTSAGWGPWELGGWGL